jgi:hypothetical protein
VMETVDRKFRLARKWSNVELKKVSELFNGKVINVSAGENIDKEGATYDTYFKNAQEFWQSNHNPGSFRGFTGKEKELLINLEETLPTELKSSFDVVFNHTTLEHIFDIFTAFKNLCLLSNDIVIIVVPFVQEQHENSSFQDFWRFTPTCLRKLFRNNGLETIYESANTDFNAATYLFFVGSKHPERWVQKMPAFKPVMNAGDWIGVSNLPKIKRFGKFLTLLHGMSSRR